MSILAPDVPVIETGVSDSVDSVGDTDDCAAAHRLNTASDNVNDDIPDDINAGVNGDHADEVSVDLPDVRAAAAALNEAGIATAVIEPGEKRPSQPGWSTGSARPEHFGSRDGVGIVTGPLSDGNHPGHAIVSVDLDTTAANTLADQYLLPTGMIDGRPGKPRSHRHYLVPLNTIPTNDNAPANNDATKAAVEKVGHPGPKTTTFKDTNGREVLALKGTGGQAVCPPSLWSSADGTQHERRDWDGGSRGEPAVVAYPDLLTAVTALARAAGAVEKPVRQVTATETVEVPDDIDLSSVIGRAVAYMAVCPPAVEGQSGHDQLFAVARAVVYGFDLGAEVGAGLIGAQYNPRCIPPWSAGEIAHKCNDADTLPFDRPRGYLFADRTPVTEPDSDETDADAGGECTNPMAAEQPDDTTIAQKPGGSKEKVKKKPKEKKPREKEPNAPSAADALVAIGSRAELWHDDKEIGYATIGRTTWPIRSRGYKLFLASEVWKQHRKAPNSEAINNALTLLEAVAIHGGPCWPVSVRVAADKAGLVYLDLADAESTVIEISPDGWTMCADPPVRFIRPTGMRPLPFPARGGAINELRTLVNVTDDEAFTLAVAWLTAALRPQGPHPVLVVSGDQGSAKSTTSKTLRSLIDPSVIALRAEPKEVRDLMIGAKNNWALTFDNLSYLPPWLSDALCRLATGGGIAGRALFTDDGEYIFTAQRPIIVNGIDDFVTRGDLFDRAMLLRLPPIPEDRRVTEEAYNAAFTAAHPRILGALLDRVAAGLRELPNVTLATLPRMADFARWSVACERGADEKPRFEEAYTANRTNADEQALDASPIATALLSALGSRYRWEVTPSALLTALETAAPDQQRGRDWPKTAAVLSTKLRRLAPNLRRVHHVDVDFAKRTTLGRLIVITRPDTGRDSSSSSSSSGRGGPAGMMGEAAAE